MSDTQAAEDVSPLHEVVHELLAALLVEDLQLLQCIHVDLLLLEGFVEVTPGFVQLLPLGLAGLLCVKFSKVLSENEVELLESGRLADAAEPEQEDGEVRMADIYLPLGIVQDQFLDVHETELVGYFFLGSHGIAQLPKLLIPYHVSFSASILASNTSSSPFSF
jgi:hypothetical protein